MKALERVFCFTETVGLSQSAKLDY